MNNPMSDVAAPGGTKLNILSRLIPILLVMLYLNGTVYVFAYGPWPYVVKDPVRLYGFLFAAHLAILLGYLSALGSKPREYTGKWDVSTILRAAAIVALILLPPTSLLVSGSLIPNVIAGINDPGGNYSESQYLRVSSTPWAFYIRMFFGPLLGLYLPLTVYYWSKIPSLLRVLGVSAIVFNLMLFIAIGTNQGLVLPIVIAPGLIYAAIKSKTLRFTKVHALITVVGFAIAAFGAANFFTQTNISRAGSSTLTGNFPQAKIVADRTHPWLNNLSFEQSTGVLGIASYVSLGYYGLSLTLDKPFVPTYGFGHSTFINRQVARILDNEEFEHLSYPERASDQDGWTTVLLFQTVYPWFASDVTFPGVVVLMFLLGRVLCLCWSDCLYGKNPFAVGLLAQLIIFILYIPALNAVLQGGEGFTTFWGLMILWLITRGKAGATAHPASSGALPQAT